MTKGRLKRLEEDVQHKIGLLMGQGEPTQSPTLFTLWDLYEFNPLSPLDLLPLPCVSSMVNLNELSKAQFACAHMEKKGEQYAKHANKGKRKKVFQEGDLVWVHITKERFPTLRKSKILLKGDGLFKVVKMINDNTYVLDMPPKNMEVMLVLITQGPNLRTNSLQKEEFDMNMKRLGEDTHEDLEHMEIKVLQGPMARGRLRKIEEEVHQRMGLLMEQGRPNQGPIIFTLWGCHNALKPFLGHHRDLKLCMYKYLEEIGFQRERDKLVDYRLKENWWISSMCKIKEKWEKCYVKNAFTIGI
ncbi:hypothetical protein CR513_38506, partial [Mucuna pruriens]